jgi:hypothetical protein
MELKLEVRSQKTEESRTECGGQSFMVIGSALSIVKAAPVDNQ